ncbi:MAG: 39S ribosomal protein L45 [Comamonadaceae bacterium]|nr:39S ribosomal protein L45 [Comamonadaceae bacterium]
MKKLWPVVLVALLTLAHVDADARRLGGGTSMGKLSSNVTQREAAPSAPAAPAQNAAPQNAGAQNAAKPATPAAPAAAPKKPWGAMLGGLAAGLGLAWLAHSLGLGAAFGNVLLFALLAFAAVAVIGMIMRSRKPAQSAAAPFAFQGAGAGAGPVPVNAPVAPQYNPEKIGNDASARPWETQGTAFEAARPAAGGVVIGSALAGSQNWGVPADFDTAGFLAAAKRNFVTLQSAWDRADVATLRSMMTDDMLTEVRSQLADREQHRGSEPNHTHVDVIEAQLLGIEDLGSDYMASVEFSGMMREEQGAGLSPFREVWNMTKPKSGSSGWLVAGLQALQ